MTKAQKEKNENLFDTTHTDDLPDNLQIGRTDDFGKDIMEIFYIAKAQKLDELNVNQVMVAFYRKFGEKYANNPKDNIKIMNKLFAMATGKKFPLEKVKNKQGTYRLKEEA